MTELTNESDIRRIRHQEAEEAAQALRTALRVNGLPTLPSLDAAPEVQGLREGGYVYLGGCNAHTAQAIADLLMLHARWTGRLLPSETDVQVLHGLLALPDNQPPAYLPSRSSRELSA